jgi:ABC-2 type transport system ATP-binding protein
MSAIAVKHISKKFGAVQAVRDISFTVNAGEIFGLLGPNGAGKTTTIRMILDIFKPDGGQIVVLGGPMTEEKKNVIGYLPEERGLYQDITLENCLLYLATLKGLAAPLARERLNVYLERFELSSYRNKKIKELSKGMQQKAQLITTLIHQPRLIIVDEPFSSLDPVNTQMVKELLVTEKQHGTTIVMSTHQMHQVEELCDRLILINKGEAILYGGLNQIRKQYAGSDLLVRTRSKIPQVMQGVSCIEKKNGTYLLHLESRTDPQSILDALVKKKIPIEQFEIALPTLDQIFIQAVTGIDSR